VHGAYVHAFTNALGTVFVVAAGVAALGFVLSWLLEQRTLRDTVVAGAGIGESFAVPKHTDSFAEAARALTVLVGREGRKRIVQRLAERAGVDLPPAACWLIVRLYEDPAADIETLCDKFDVPRTAGHEALAELERRGLVEVATGKVVGQPGASEGAGPPTNGVRALTPAGEETAAKLIAARRESLARLCDGWPSERQGELAGFLTRLARELAAEPAEYDVPAAA
jgi:DNA-binding MarR family transcriptional regulator